MWLGERVKIRSGRVLDVRATLSSLAVFRTSLSPVTFFLFAFSAPSEREANTSQSRHPFSAAHYLFLPFFLVSPSAMASSLDVYSSKHDEPFPSGLSSSEMKLHLQSLLDGKEKQLQQAGMLGQRVLAQQTELEDRIRQLQEFEGDGELATETSGRYQELAEVIAAWDAENAELSSTFGPKVCCVRVFFFLFFFFPAYLSLSSFVGR